METSEGDERRPRVSTWNGSDDIDLVGGAGNCQFIGKGEVILHLFGGLTISVGGFPGCFNGLCIGPGLVCPQEEDLIILDSGCEMISVASVDGAFMVICYCVL